MGKGTVSIPLVTLRPDGLGGFRPRYIPGKRHRRLGFRGEDMLHADGSWFSLDECAAWSAARLREVAAVDAARPRERRRLVARGAGLTLGQLFARWFLEPRMNGVAVVEGKKERRPLKPSTVEFYRAGAARIEELDDGLLWLAPARAITSRMIGDESRGVLHKIEVARGLHVAHCVRATLSAMFGWAVAADLVPANPVAGATYKMPAPAPRLRYGSIAEMQHLVAAADAIGRHDVGDAIMLGLWTGQRQGDRRELVDGQLTPDGIVFRQGKKHGQTLLIPNTPELAARLRAARLRRREWRVNYPHVLLDETTRKPFDRHRYKKQFALVRQAAVEGIVGVLPPMPSLADFHDQDLRDTAVTWLALAACTKPEIASITGHSLGTIDVVLKHYLGLHPDLARSAIGKLVAWAENQQQGDGA